jgi:hypothetical protein
MCSNRRDEQPRLSELPTVCKSSASAAPAIDAWIEAITDWDDLWPPYDWDDFD